MESGDRMTDQTLETSPNVYARAAGMLYLVIIVLGLFSEMFVRSPLIAPGDAAATASHIMAAEGIFRAGFLADSIMVLSDGVLAVLLFILLKPVNTTLALMALCFRLMQTAVITLNLLNYYATLLLLKGATYTSVFEVDQLNALASLFLDLHSHGYDLGLILFGIHCLVLGYLIAKSLYLPKVLGYLVMAAGITYLIGSYTRFLFPNLVAAVAPIYLVAIVSELSLCLWLLIKGVDLEGWQKMTGSTGVA
jgi:hypothetical protein